MADTRSTSTAVMESTNDATGFVEIHQGQGLGAQIGGTNITATVQLQYRRDANSPTSIVRTYTFAAVDGTAETDFVSSVEGEYRLIATAFTSATNGTLALIPGAYMGR